MATFYPKISIVTATYNIGKYIEQSILSLISQGYPNLEFIVIDGGSIDNTLQVINKYRDYISYFNSAPDNGLYDALSKGFAKSNGEIMGWLNGDDIHHEKSLFTIAEIFSTFPSVRWIQGYPNVIDERGRILYHRKARNYYQEFLDRKYRDGVFIQQESTFWTRSLWEAGGSRISNEFKFAGDFELWMRYFEHDVLYTTSAMLGAFRVRQSGQLSKENYGEYLKECDEIVDRALAGHPNKLQHTINFKMLAGKMTRLVFGHFVGHKRESQRIGKEIHYDFESSCFKMNS